MRRAIRSLSPCRRRNKRIMVNFSKKPNINPDIKHSIKLQETVSSNDTCLTQKWDMKQTKFLLDLNRKVNLAKKSRFNPFRSPLVLNQMLSAKFDITSNRVQFPRFVKSPKLRVLNNL